VRERVLRLVAVLILGWVTPGGSLPQAARPTPAYDPNIYAAAVDTEVTYDNFVAQSYDDGYGPRAFTQFEAALAPYGAWLDDPSLGRVWIPAPAVVGADFAPYASNGRWVLTDYGWTWESGWDWGWAPFHYGRWATAGKDHRWCWVPGTLWGPAWVSWRAGRHYVGWAPLPPRGMNLGRPLGTRSPWRFVQVDSLGTERLAFLPPRLVPSIFGRTAVVSAPRWIKSGALTIRANAGPTEARCCRDRGGPARPLAAAAPHAVPRLTIRARPGAPLPARPWVAAGVREQTTVDRWPMPRVL
jgi:hypothetical protein